MRRIAVIQADRSATREMSEQEPFALAERLISADGVDREASVSIGCNWRERLQCESEGNVLRRLGIDSPRHQSDIFFHGLEDDEGLYRLGYATEVYVSVYADSVFSCYAAIAARDWVATVNPYAPVEVVGSNHSQGESGDVDDWVACAQRAKALTHGRLVQTAFAVHINPLVHDVARAENLRMPRFHAAPFEFKFNHLRLLRLAHADTMLDAKEMHRSIAQSRGWNNQLLSELFESHSSLLYDLGFVKSRGALSFTPQSLRFIERFHPSLSSEETIAAICRTRDMDLDEAAVEIERVFAGLAREQVEFMRTGSTGRSRGVAHG
jgi:hypothetical protein